MRDALIKQLEIDMKQTLLRDKDHVFNTEKPSDDMRYWSRSPATILIHNGRLLCRSDSENLTQALKDKYKTCNAQWFGEIKNLKELEALLNVHGYTIVNYAPFYIPSPQFTLEDDPNIEVYFDEEILQFKGLKGFDECYCFEEKDPDLIGVSIKENHQIVAMAGINRNGKNSLEIGISVLPIARGKGYATRLVKAITGIAMKRFPGMVIMYGTQFTHMQSMNVASRSGFEYALTQIMIHKIQNSNN